MRTALITLIAATLLAGPAAARMFYDDDPLTVEPAPLDVEDAAFRELSDYYDFFQHLFWTPGELNGEGQVYPAQAVDTLGEPMDGAWYTRRHYYNRMSVAELVAGPGNENPPSTDGPWIITAAKSEGVTPGFMIEDSRGEVYVLKFDPIEYPGLATGADMISSKIFHAAGYSVPEYYIVHFRAEQLELGDDVELRDSLGQSRKMTRRDVTELLVKAPRDKDGRWRGIASRYLPGKPLGPFRYYGVRSDDPNDVVPHEHRRDLRGLRVLCAWLNHDDSRAVNSLDMLVEEDGRRFIRHHLIDFGSTLGSATGRPNTPRNGYEYIFNAGTTAKQFFTLGLWVPRWAKKKFPGIRSVGSFESKVFDPVRWVPEYPNPAFSNALPDDLFWGAKLVMAFTDEEIRAIVKVAEYPDPGAEEYVAETLIERRDKIGRAFFEQVLPLDRFSVRDGELVFEDLGLKYGFVDSRDYTVAWSNFDNQTGEMTAVEQAFRDQTTGRTGFRAPLVCEGGYVAAEIHGGNPVKSVTVYLRNRAGTLEVVGIERGW